MPDDQLYHMANIRELLIKGFDDAELRDLCMDVPGFRPVFDRLARGMRKDEIVTELLGYAERQMQIDTLLALAQERNSKRYEEHGPYYVADPTPTLQRQVTDLAKRLAELTSPTALTRDQQYQIAFHWVALGSKDSLCNFDLSEGDLVGANLGGADLRGANLSDADLSTGDLSGALLHKAKMVAALLHRSKLTGANLYKANLSRADLREADLHEADLTGANLSRANLSGANLSRANLRGADLTGAYLYKANLSRANLSKANLRGAYLTGTDLIKAYLSVANLRGANLSWIDLIKANLRGPTMPSGSTHD